MGIVFSEEMSATYHEGWIAYCEGVGYWENPYRGKSIAKLIDWADGWLHNQKNRLTN